MVGQAAGRISIMPGGGVTGHNIAEILRTTGAREIHLSAREAVKSAMLFRNPDCFMGAYSKAGEYEWREASVEMIRLAKERMGGARGSQPMSAR